MNPKQMILDRLFSARQAWPEWEALVQRVLVTDFQRVTYDYLGDFLEGRDLTFSAETISDLPKWLPAWVSALAGLQSDTGEMSGGFGLAFDGSSVRSESIFSPAGNDSLLGFPRIRPDPSIYYFQYNASGAQFFIDEELRIRVPNAETGKFDVLDTLESFARNNIQTTLSALPWHSAYSGQLKSYTLLD